MINTTCNTEGQTQVEVYIGDGDVLIGFTSVKPNLARVWLSPLPQPSPIPLNNLTPVNKVPGVTNEPPKDTVATLYFVNKVSLAEFIKGLQTCLEKM